MKKQIKLNESQFTQIVKRFVNEAMQDYIKGMPRFKSRDEYTDWLTQQKNNNLQANLDDDEWYKTPYGQYQNMKIDRKYNKPDNIYYPQSGAGSTFMDNKYRTNQTNGTNFRNSSFHKNFVKQHTVNLPNGGVKWNQNHITESQLIHLIKESIKRIITT